MKITTLEEYARGLEERKARLGIKGKDYVARNSGTRRTRSKRALLAELEQDARAKKTLRRRARKEAPASDGSQ